MTQTEALLDGIVGRLKTAFGAELGVELFPENPTQFRLNHPRGAVLVAFGKSTFGGSEATDAMFQERNLVISLTLVFRQLNGKDGAVSYLDRIRDTLTGWWPPHCDQALRPVSERFIGHLQGVWQYGLDIATRATQLQTMALDSGPLLTQTRFEEQP
ncbi:MAG: Gp37 family protein [Pseudomonas sp.]|nr:Gp37 family protein [Pseudomonas sp.]